MNLDDAKETFVVEARELLEEMESALLALEDGPADAGLVDAVFRAAHTLKGSGGVFGYERLERFTHRMESVLDRVRNGALAIDAAIVAVLLDCRDHLVALVDAEVGDLPLDETRELSMKATLVRLEALLATEMELRRPCKTAEHWYIDLRFSRDALRNGLEPLALIRYLEQMGFIERVAFGLGALSEAAEFEPECCYVELGLLLGERVERSEIDAALEFFREDAEIAIVPPGASLEDYGTHIGGGQEVAKGRADRLVTVGAITAEERDRLMAAHKPGINTKDALESAAAAERTALDTKEPGKESAGRPVGRRTLRIDADKLDRLINLVGELVIAGAATHVIARHLGVEGLVEANSAVNRLVEEIRDNALRLRMVQIGDTFNRFHRVVRDVSHEVGKSIRLEVAGDETELDKTVVEKIGDPLMHLLRNAMDHGIEPEEERLAAGKPAQGTVGLNAFHDSGSIVIEVSDDGRGLDLDAIAEKAVANGLIAPNQQLSEAEIQRIIFEPGISTAGSVTNLSGRGVGMDVVRRNIEALRGTVDLESAKGLGTKFTIRLPLTLAIIDGFLVRIGEAPYVIPLDMVHECIELAQTGGGVQGGGGRYINLRGEALPYLVLRELFGDVEERGLRENIVVVKHGGRKAGLVVDFLQGEMQTVIKPLGKVFQQLSGISGATILGSGEVAVILDVPQLVQMASSKERRIGRESASAVV